MKQKRKTVCGNTFETLNLEECNNHRVQVHFIRSEMAKKINKYILQEHNVQGFIPTPELQTSIRNACTLKKRLMETFKQTERAQLIQPILLQLSFIKQNCFLLVFSIVLGLEVRLACLECFHQNVSCDERTKGSRKLYKVHIMKILLESFHISSLVSQVNLERQTETQFEQ